MDRACGTFGCAVKRRERSINKVRFRWWLESTEIASLAWFNSFPGSIQDTSGTVLELGDMTQEA